jgi:hypothetical protein
MHYYIILIQLWCMLNPSYRPTRDFGESGKEFIQSNGTLATTFIFQSQLTQSCNDQYEMKLKYYIILYIIYEQEKYSSIYFPANCSEQQINEHIKNIIHELNLPLNINCNHSLRIYVYYYYANFYHTCLLCLHAQLHVSCVLCIVNFYYLDLLFIINIYYIYCILHIYMTVLKYAMCIAV